MNSHQNPEANRKLSINNVQVENMGPLEKYEKYNRFPFKLIVSILLIIFTTCQAVLIVSEANKYSRSQERFLYNMFIDTDDKRNVDYSRKAYLYSVEDVQNHVKASINNFYSLKSKSLEIVQFTVPNPYIRMEFTYIDNEKIKKIIRKEIESEKDYFPFNNTIPFNITENEINSSDSESPLIRKNIIPKRFDYIATNISTGPFDYSEDDIKEFINDVVEFRLYYTLKTYVPYFYSNNYDCNMWTVTQFYNFATRGHFVVRLNIIRLSCEDYTGGHSYADLFINKLLWIHLIVLVLAIVSLILTWNYITYIASMYMKAKTKHKQKIKGEDENALYTKSEDSIYYNPLLDENLRKQNEEETERARLNYNDTDKDNYNYEDMIEYEINNNNNNENSAINYKEYYLKHHTNKHSYTHYPYSHPKAQEVKFKFNPYADEDELDKLKKTGPIFNKWSLIALIGNIIQIFASAICIFDTDNILPSTEILIGFGCMFSFLAIGKYIEYSENYSAIYVTIKHSLPNVGRYLLGVTPIFLGFLFFGLCIFWRSERFTNTSNVMIILFSLAQGDSVFDAFKDLSGIYFFLGQLYLYLFCIIFIVVVLNIFIAIIEEAYVTSKMENKTHWVFDYIKKDTKQTMRFKPPIDEMNKAKLLAEQDQELVRGRELEKKKIKGIKAYTSKHLANNLMYPKSLKANEDNIIDKKNHFKDFKDFNFKEEKNRSLQNEKLMADTNENEITELSIYQKRIEEEFISIEEEIKTILQLSLEIKIYGDEALIDELRLNVLDRINGTILVQTDEIRSIVSEW